MPSRPITPHRFARLIAWLCAVLAWVASSAPARRNRAAPPLTKLRDMVRCTIIIIAADHVSAPKRAIPRRYGKPPRKLASLRAIGGTWLRTKLRTRGSIIAQAKHLIAALADRHALARELAHRRRNPFTRLAPILACAGASAMLAAGTPALDFVNSS